MRGDGDFEYGVPRIAVFVNDTPKAVYHRLRRHGLPGARKLGKPWVLHKPTYLEAFRSDASDRAA
jgi:hypothetical protein